MKYKLFTFTSIIIGIVLSLMLTIILWYSIFGPEQYYYFDPYIDTEMAAKYTPDKFDEITLNMSKDEVILLIGKPLNVFQDTLRKHHIEHFYYTADGKILNKKMPWYMANDYAWYRSSVDFNSQNKVVKIDKGWSYD